MMDKISYLRGLMEGLGVHPESREGKLFGAVCDALEANKEYISKLESRIEELETFCDALDADLGALEEKEEDYGCEACLSSEKKMKYQCSDDAVVKTEKEPEELPLELALNDDDSDLLDEEEYETQCPTCGTVIMLDEQMMEEGCATCPKCGEELEFDFDEEELERLSPDGAATDTSTEK